MNDASPDLPVVRGPCGALRGIGRGMQMVKDTVKSLESLDSALKRQQSRSQVTLESSKLRVIVSKPAKHLPSNGLFAPMQSLHRTLSRLTNQF